MCYIHVEESVFSEVTSMSELEGLVGRANAAGSGVACTLY